MKNYSYLFCLFAGILLSTALFSQQLKIGHVNFDKIMLAMPERDSARTIIEKETKDLQSEYEKMVVSYNQAYDDYQKKLSTFSEIVKRTKEDELLDKQKRTEEFRQNATKVLDDRNVELLKPIIEKVKNAIDKVAAENGFTYILDISKGSVVYTSKESQDITPLVLKIVKS